MSHCQPTNLQLSPVVESALRRKFTSERSLTKTKYLLQQLALGIMSICLFVRKHRSENSSPNRLPVPERGTHLYCWDICALVHGQLMRWKSTLPSPEDTFSQLFLECQGTNVRNREASETGNTENNQEKVTALWYFATEEPLRQVLGFLSPQSENRAYVFLALLNYDISRAIIAVRV